MSCSNSLCTKSNHTFLPLSCGLCKEQRYCGRLCRLEDWRTGHSLICERRQLEKLRHVELTCPFVKTGQVLNDAEADIKVPRTTSINPIYEPITSTKNLGRGAYGEVVLMNDMRQDKQVAMKIISKRGIRDKKTIESFNNEINIHKRIIHDNIIRLFSYAEDERSIYIVMEYAKGGNLFRLLRNKIRFSEKEAFYYFMQTCSAIDFLHRNGLMHRDIKPENLLITEDKILKLCDFGCCIKTDNELTNDYCGTIEYMAPEMLRRGNYGKKADIWSLGILLYELLHGYAPYRCGTGREAIRRISRQLPVFKYAHDDAKELIELMLNKDPSKRPEVWEIFLHPWVKRMQEVFGISEMVRKDVDIKSSKIIHLDQSTQDSQVSSNSSDTKNGKYVYKENSAKGIGSPINSKPPGPKVSLNTKITKPLSGNLQDDFNFLEEINTCSKDTYIEDYKIPIDSNRQVLKALNCNGISNTNNKESKRKV